MARRAPCVGTGLRDGWSVVIVYVSGASSELERAEAFIAECRRAGIMISLDWTAFFRRQAAGERVEPAECVAADVRGVMDADALVVLLPTDGRTSRGLWVEVGVAIAEGTEIVWVGEEGTADIWGCLGTWVADDAEALRVLRSALEVAEFAGLRR